MKPSERLLDRLRAMGLPVPEGARIVRTHAGPWQRAAGAWSWSVYPTDGAYAVGSQVPVTELLRGQMAATRDWLRADHGDWHVHPAAEAVSGSVLEAVVNPTPRV